MSGRSLSTAADLANGTLHHRIRTDLEGKILSGEWPPGHRVPFEHELMAGYACSRMTVNKVLSGLAAEGLIERRRRAGSFVRRPQFQSAVLQIHDIKAEVSGRGQAYAYELLSQRRRKANAGDRELLSVGPHVGIIALRCRHLADGRPFALEERLINLAAIPAGRNDRLQVRAARHLASRPCALDGGRASHLGDGGRCRDGGSASRWPRDRHASSCGAAPGVPARPSPWFGSSFRAPSYHLVARFTPSQTVKPRELARAAQLHAFPHAGLAAPPELLNSSASAATPPTYPSCSTIFMMRGRSTPVRRPNSRPSMSRRALRTKRFSMLIRAPSPKWSTRSAMRSSASTCATRNAKEAAAARASSLRRTGSSSPTAMWSRGSIGSSSRSPMAEGSAAASSAMIRTPISPSCAPRSRCGSQARGSAIPRRCGVASSSWRSAIRSASNRP